MSADAAARRWHVGEWGLLGWAETVVKLAGVGVGVAALAIAVDRPSEGPEGVARWAAVVVLAVLCLGLLAAIADRLIEREIVGIVFIVAMVVGHVAMLIAVLRDPGVGPLLFAFADLMFVGDIVKLVWLSSTGFTVRDLPRAAVYGLVGTYLTGYSLLYLIAFAL